jgi:hypothetical protein
MPGQAQSLVTAALTSHSSENELSGTAATNLGCVAPPPSSILEIKAYKMMEMGSLVYGCPYAVQIPDDIDIANVLTLLQTRLSAMTGFPDLYKEALGISPFLLDMKSGAIYWCLARVPLLTVRPRLPALRDLP